VAARSSSLAPEDVLDDAHEGAHLRHHLLLHEIEAHGDQRHAWNSPCAVASVRGSLEELNAA